MLIHSGESCLLSCACWTHSVQDSLKWIFLIQMHIYLESYRITLSIISVMEISTDQTWRLDAWNTTLEFVFLSPRKQQFMNCLLYTLNCHNDRLIKLFDSNYYNLVVLQNHNSHNFKLDIWYWGKKNRIEQLVTAAKHHVTWLA